MNINKKSWHYWLYTISYDEEGKAPVNTNLCQYMRRVIFVGPYKVFALVCLFIGLVIWNLLNGKLPISWDTEKTVDYAPSVGEVAIRPWHIIALLIMAYLYYNYTMEALLITGLGIGAVVGEIINNRWAIVGVPVIGYLYWHYTIIMVTISALAIVVIIALIAISYSEAWHITKEFIKAKKRKICPIIEFQ